MPESDTFDEYLYRASDEKRRSIYGDEVYIIGLIEFTNYCRNNCYYCGMRIFIIRIHFYFVIICSYTQTLTPLLQEPHRMPAADSVDQVFYCLTKIVNCFHHVLNFFTLLLLILSDLFLILMIVIRVNILQVKKTVIK